MKCHVISRRHEKLRMSIFWTTSHIWELWFGRRPWAAFCSTFEYESAIDIPTDWLQQYIQKTILPRASPSMKSATFVWCFCCCCVIHEISQHFWHGYAWQTLSKMLLMLYSHPYLLYIPTVFFSERSQIWKFMEVTQLPFVRTASEVSSELPLRFGWFRCDRKQIAKPAMEDTVVTPSEIKCDEVTKVSK